jgi:two-component system chemotaxis sensor kinase CheA
MAIDLDDDILQDFLVEAGELMEQLGEQLVELEQAPDDKDLLNAVFRAFHTIKGGAGFVNLVPMVELCHRAEDVFNLLRQGERQVDAELMDAVLRALDVLNDQFDAVRAGQDPMAADAALLGQLEALAGGAAATPAAAPPAPASEGDITDGEGDITDEEFEQLLDAMAGESPAAATPATAGKDDEITDDEFEALLDQMHGKGRHGGVPKAGPAASAAPAAAKGDDEHITEDEFESLLDELHGPGKAAAKSAASTPAASAPASAPAAVVADKAAKPAAETSVRVDTRRLDEIMNLVGELVLVRNRLATLQQNIRDEEIAKTVANLDMVTSDIQAAVMMTRMQPIKKVFGRFPRVVRDLARSLKKEVNLTLIGEETDLDKNLVEALADPLVHLVRNAVDHGIEMPEERVAAGKPRQGEVILSASQEGDHILITIEDDGKGMDPEVLRNKAVEKGVLAPEQAARLSDVEAYNLIFAPGFSTKTEISDVSGRGVGMDVVKTRINQLNGTVEIDSEKGRGSRLSIKLPLTLAILPTLMIMVGGQHFALPLSNVRETYDLDLSKTSMVDDQEVLLVRGKPLPLFYLQRWLSRNGRSYGKKDRASHQVVVVEVGTRAVCFVVDELIGQEEVVIKPLGVFLHGKPGFAGATITGDGRIALIIDVPSLLKANVRRF